VFGFEAAQSLRGEVQISSQLFLGEELKEVLILT
jgi:hypothetical protein